MKKHIGSDKYNLDTPCLIIDYDKFDDNLRKMQDFGDQSGKKLRPHAKTHKCSVIAKKQLELGAIGVCAAKLSEAEVLIAKGIQNVLITGPVVTDQKIERLLKLLGDLKTNDSIMLVVDHPDNIKMLHDKLKQDQKSLDVLLDIDVGLERTGCAPENALALAKEIEKYSTLQLRGIQAYAGQVQHIQSYKNRQCSSLKCMEKARTAFKQLENAGFNCEIFTGTGTGTYNIDIKIPELTDLQVGSYAVMDSEYLAVGSECNSENFADFQPALTLLTSVISVNQKQFVTVDAGLKTIYQHGGIPRVTGTTHSGMTYDWFGDEYGKIIFPANTLPPLLGKKLELIVSHCDPTINLFDYFYVTKNDKVIDIWPIDLRGKSQ